MIDQKSVTIIIPHLGITKEQCYSLGQCLESLRETVPSMQIIVAKNGNVACACRRDIRILAQGQCKSANAGVATVNTEWIFVTNDDMVYSSGWWDKLTAVSFGDKDGKYSHPLCISPQLVEPRSGAPTFITEFCGGAGGDFDKQKFLEFVKTNLGGFPRTGFNLPFLISRELWDTIGGYDINYDPWGSNSDSDLEYKIKLAGVQPMQETNCWVYHFSQTSGTSNPENQGCWGKNFQYFIDKWGFTRTDSGIWEANFEIPAPPVRKFTPEWEGKYK